MTVDWQSRCFRCTALLLLSAVLLAASGCTTPPADESDLPWNSPQPWEGSIMIPGMEGR